MTSYSDLLAKHSNAQFIAYDYDAQKWTTDGVYDDGTPMPMANAVKMLRREVAAAHARIEELESAADEPIHGDGSREINLDAPLTAREADAAYNDGLTPAEQMSPSVFRCPTCEYIAGSGLVVQGANGHQQLAPDFRCPECETSGSAFLRTV